MNLISIDMGDKKYSGSRILLHGTCVPLQHAHYLKKLAHGKIILRACLQNHHMDNLGFKLATLLTYQPVKEITVLTLDGSPHCVQLHALCVQAKRITKAKVRLKHFVIEEGDLIEIPTSLLKVARHLSQIKSLYDTSKKR